MNCLKNLLRFGVAGTACYGGYEGWQYYNEQDLKGKVVVITGGGMGLGRLVSCKLASQGCKVAVWDMNEKMAQETADMIRKAGGEANTYICDVSDSSAVRTSADKVRKDFGQVDILINNAGIVSGKKIFDVPEGLARKTMDVNTTSHFWTVKSFLPEMIARNSGQVVTVASAAGLIGVAGLCDYCASKFGAFGFNEALHYELRRLKKTGVSTTCVCPFYINTGMFEGVKTKYPLILPILEPEYVAYKIVQAIKRRREVLYLPRVVRFACLNRIVPAPIGDFFMEFLGISSSMDEFKGH